MNRVLLINSAVAIVLAIITSLLLFGYAKLQQQESIVLEALTGQVKDLQMQNKVLKDGMSNSSAETNSRVKDVETAQSNLQGELGKLRSNILGNITTDNITNGTITTDDINTSAGIVRGQLASTTRPVRTATLTVCASNALNKTQCDYTADGTADEVQIQAAIDDLPAEGGVVRLSEGTFTISSTITLSKLHARLIGSGRSTTLTTSDSIAILTIAENGIWISEMELASSNYTAYGVVIGNISGNMAEAHIEYVRFYKLSQGIRLANTSGHSLNWLFITNNEFQDNVTGVDSQASGDGINNVLIQGNRFGLTSSRHLWLIGNIMAWVTIENNHFSTSNVRHIELNKVRYLRFIGNLITGSQEESLILYNMIGLTMMGNIYQDIGAKTGNTYDVITLAGGQDVVISGETFGVVSGGTPRRDITIGTGNISNSNIRISNNIFAGFGTIAVGVDETVTALAITKNSGYKTENSGVDTLGDGWSFPHGLVATPTSISIQSSVSGEIVAVTEVTSTTVSISIKKRDGSSGTTQTVYWRVALGAGN